MEFRRLVHLPEVGRASLQVWKDNDQRITHQIVPPDGHIMLLVQPKRRGAVLGDHYHRGLDPSKGPEVLHIVAGEWRLQMARVVDGAITGPIHLSLENTPAVYHIGPLIWHRLTLLSTHGLLVEFAQRGSQPEDTFTVSNAPAIQPP